MASREALLLVVVASLGAYPASRLSARFDGAARLALAPVLGLCAGVCVSTTVLYFASGSAAFWVIPVLAAASLIGAQRRRMARRVGVGARGRSPHGATVVDGLHLLAVVLVVAGPLTYAFAARHSVGPVGYRVGDAQGYVASIDAAQRESLPTTVRLLNSAASRANLEQRYASAYASGFQELDATPLFADVNALAGFQGSDTQSAFLAASLLAGALGLFGAARYGLQRRSWAAVLGGGLFGGAFFLQLFFDSSEGALLGLCVLAPLVAIGHEAIRAPRAANLALVSLLVAGLVGLYPLFVPAVGVGAVAGLLANRDRAPRATTGIARSLAAGALGLGAMLSAAAVANVVDLLRALRYWAAALHAGIGGPHLPRYPFLQLGVLASWLEQSRQFYDLAAPGGTWLARIGLTVVVPLIGGALVVTGARHPLAWFALGIFGASCAFAAFEHVANTCSYCEDRSLLPVAPIVALLIAVGLGACAASSLRSVRASGALTGTVIVVAVAAAGYGSITRFRDGAYFLDPGIRTALASLQPGATVALEGFNTQRNAIIQQGLVYMTAEEHSWGEVSLPADSNRSASLFYLSGRALPLVGPQFRPDYAYVLTGIPEVATSRRTVARAGDIALERRARGGDVLADFGLEVVTASDTNGPTRAVAVGGSHLQFLETGTDRRLRYVQLVFALAGGTRVTVLGPEVVALSQRQTALDVCLRLGAFTGPRGLQLSLEGDANLRLTAMRATIRCTISKPG